MKRCVILLLGIFYIHICYAQISVKVDERFELTSIMFGLAGVPEYCQCNIPSYLQDVIDELTPYERTEAINYIRELNQFHQIGYNLVAKTAEALEIKNGEIELQPKYDISKISEFDSRWTEELFAKFLTLTNEFYKQTNFHQFFEEHLSLYSCAEQQMQVLLTEEVNDWFVSFYGKSLDPNLTIYISLWNGPNNYSIPNGVVIGMTGDANGNPIPDKNNTLSLLIHELSHHFMNYIVEQHWSQLQSPATQLYHLSKEIFDTNSAYAGAKTIMNEWLTALATISYLQEHNNDVWGKFLIKKKTEEGFIWMQRSVNLMDRFYANRQSYSCFQEFMPQIIEFVKLTANNPVDLIREYETRQPYIVNVEPALGSNILNAKEITITFSKPMLGSYGFNGTGGVNLKPLYFNSIKWNDSKTKMIIVLNSDLIKENQEYGLLLQPRGFLSSDYYQLNKNTSRLYFNTCLK